MISAVVLASTLLSLTEAVHQAVQHNPQLRQAHFSTAAARARVIEARAPLLPQLVGTGIYQQTTANFVNKPGSVPADVAKQQPASFATFDYFSFGVTASQLLFDGLGALQGWRAAEAQAEAQVATERQQMSDVILAVRTAYFNARAMKELVRVAREALANQARHLSQIEGYVEAGTRPAIDLAQARLDRDTAAVAMTLADNNYAIAKAQLNQAMGVERIADYDLADDTLPAVEGEDGNSSGLVAEALRARADLVSLERQIVALERTVWQNRAGYAPALNFSSTLNAAGVDIANLTPNWNATLSLTWPLFQGLVTFGQVREAEANLNLLQAQRDAFRQQVLLDVETARLRVRAAKSAIGSAADALLNARERLKLAEGRYRAGVGNGIELGDAQVALTNAAALNVQAEYGLATARALLLRALGRRNE
jgi:outer membrane protein